MATADFQFANGYATVTVQTTAPGELTPGFHGLHVHSVGKCEANSVAPTGGAPGDFNSAGGHFQVPGHSGHPASGDLTSLQVRGDGSATLVTTTDAFTAEELLAGAKTAIIIHEKSDNFANIPPERYQQINGTPPPDETTLATGDAGSGWRAVLSAPVSSRIDFAGSPRPTVGVEWEFALVDADTRDLSNEAAAVIAEIGENPHVHKELLRNTVEIVTGICENTGQAMEDLRSTLRTARPIVRDRGMELFCAGTHPFAKWSAQKLTDAPRYAELIKRTQWWGRQMLIWGVHVHVGISSAHKVMPIITSLLNQYPHLLALSASSPFWDGEDTGYASNRAMMFQQLPTAGLPFQFQTWAEFEGLRPVTRRRPASSTT